MAKVASWGDPNSKLLICGMAPGRQELAQGKPFVGGSGRILWSLAERLEPPLHREDCFIMNVIDELPQKKDGSPTDAQIEACRERFEDEALRMSYAHQKLR
jgi:DNA polymerase